MQAQSEFLFEQMRTCGTPSWRLLQEMAEATNHDQLQKHVKELYLKSSVEEGGEFFLYTHDYKFTKSAQQNYTLCTYTLQSTHRSTI